MARSKEMQAEIQQLRELLRKATREPAASQPPQDPPATATRDHAVDQHMMDCVVLIKGDRSSGTGFLVGTGRRTYLYTAAHVLSGNSKLTVHNASGRRFASFGNLEAAEGADLVRLLLLGESPATKFELIAPGAPLPPGSPVMVLGNSGGAGVVAVETGRVLGHSGESLEVDAGVIQGNSGSPVIEVASGKVAGMITHLTAERKDIWARGLRFGEVRRFACRLDQNWKWKALPVKDFFAEAARIEEFDKLTKVALAISSLTPGAEGLRLDQNLAGNVTILGIFNEAKDLPIMAELMTMNQELADKRLKPSETDLNRRLRGVIGSVLSTLKQNSTGFNPARFTWFHRKHAEESVAWRDKAEKQLRTRQAALQ
jgi:hypothetical protein